MNNPNSTLAKLLVAYYGFIQALHLIGIGRATAVLETTGEMTFPAPPPAGGWSEQAINFFVGVGAIDALNVILALVFVCGFFKGARWRGWLGALTLTVAAYSALLFAFATIPTGAVPVLVLMVAFGYWLATGRLDGAKGGENAKD
jgi:hypothetical protein